MWSQVKNDHDRLPLRDAKRRKYAIACRERNCAGKSHRDLVSGLTCNDRSGAQLLYSSGSNSTRGLSWDIVTTVVALNPRIKTVRGVIRAAAKPGPQPMPCGCQNAPNRFVFEAERRRDAKSLAKPQFCFPHRNTLTCVRVCVRGGGSVRGSHQLMVSYWPGWPPFCSVHCWHMRRFCPTSPNPSPCQSSESVAKTVPSTGCWLILQPTAARTTTPT